MVRGSFPIVFCYLRSLEVAIFVVKFIFDLMKEVYEFNMTIGKASVKSGIQIVMIAESGKCAWVSLFEVIHSGTIFSVALHYH